MITNIKIYCKSVHEFRNLEKLLVPFGYFYDKKNQKLIDEGRNLSDESILECINNYDYVLYNIRETSENIEITFCEFGCENCHSSICNGLKLMSYQKFIREFKLKRLLKCE